jgi:hypothetical protein
MIEAVVPELCHCVPAAAGRAEAPACAVPQELRCPCSPTAALRATAWVDDHLGAEDTAVLRDQAADGAPVLFSSRQLERSRAMP